MNFVLNLHWNFGMNYDWVISNYKRIFCLKFLLFNFFYFVCYDWLWLCIHNRSTCHACMFYGNRVKLVFHATFGGNWCNGIGMVLKFSGSHRTTQPTPYPKNGGLWHLVCDICARFMVFTLLCFDCSTKITLNGLWKIIFFYY